MLERAAKLLALVFLAATLLDGCAYFSKNGRQQMAYERYVRKCSKQRDRYRAKMKTKAPKIPSMNPRSRRRRARSPAHLSQSPRVKRSRRRTIRSLQRLIQRRRPNRPRTRHRFTGIGLPPESTAT